MNKAKRDQKIVGEKAFYAFYRHLTKTDADHQALIASLHQKNVPSIVINPQYANELENLWSKHKLSLEYIPWFPGAAVWPQELPFPSKLPGYDQHWFYVLNQASLLPVLALEVESGDVVLDACAAPGGKTIAMQWSSSIKNATFVANELSPQRYFQLKKDLKAYGLNDIEVANLPAEVIAAKTGDVFDKILLDAPCSSEKHVLQNNRVLQAWTPKRISKLVDKQYRMIKSLLKALKIGGTLVYSTCAINTQENEMIVGKILKNAGAAIALEHNETLPSIGATGLQGTYAVDYDISKVFRVLPHIHNGFDPMFIAKFKRLK
jgi:16S rRNA C967 or C1407 C5-methylase (RsmB/RsmF family)